MSLGIIITHFMCMVHWLASSNKPTTHASTAYCKVRRALAWKRKFLHCLSWFLTPTVQRAISWSGSLWSLWNLLISLHTITPHLNLLFFCLNLLYFFSEGALVVFGFPSSLFSFQPFFSPNCYNFNLNWVKDIPL